MAVIDVVTFNGEQDLWDIHYNVLKDHVDEFIVVEFDKTFSGQLKQSTFPVEQYPDVTYVFAREADYEKYRELAESSPNTQGADHWKLEFCQKESIKDALTHLQDDDTVFVGDVDEVWNPLVLRLLHTYNKSIKLKLNVYAYYLNNKSSEEFYGTLVTPYILLKDVCLNHLRSSRQHLTNLEQGWHFTSMGGAVSLAKKLTDSYTQESYATPAVLENLEYNMAENKDFLGRNFTYATDESEWPQYLKDNREKYKHLIK